MTEGVCVVTSKDRDCHTRAAKYDLASHTEERGFAIWRELSALARSMRSNLRGVSSRDAVERFPSGCERRAEMILIPDRVLLARNNGGGSVPRFLCSTASDARVLGKIRFVRSSLGK